MPLRTGDHPEQGVHANRNARFRNVFPHPFRLRQVRQHDLRLASCIAPKITRLASLLSIPARSRLFSIGPRSCKWVGAVASKRRAEP